MIPSEAVGITWDQQGSEGTISLPHSTHSHAWSGKENGYLFPGLSLHNYLLNVSFWKRNMCLVSPRIVSGSQQGTG